MPNPFFSLQELETLARKKSVIHSIDPRIKIIASFFILVALLRVSTYDFFAALLLISPLIYWGIVSETSWRVIFTKLLIPLPFIILVGIFNPLLDTEPRLVLDFFYIAGGWVSLLVILLRGILALITVLLLAATTPFESICVGLIKLKVPQVIVTQLKLTWRFIWVAAMEVSSTMRACYSRGRRRTSIREAIIILTHLLAKTIHRGRKNACAIWSRGGNTQLPEVRELQLQCRDFNFLLIIMILTFLPAWL